MRQPLVALLFALSCALPLLPTSVRAQDRATAEDREARQNFQAGKEAFDAEDFATALTNFQRAYELSPRPVLLYNIAKSEDNLGQKREARDHYKRFLAAVPDAPNRAQVERRVAELEIEIAREPASVATPTEAASTVAAEEPASAPLSAPAPERDERIVKKWWFWTGLGVVVAGGVAAGVIAATRSGGGGDAEPSLLNDMTHVREL